MSLFGSLSVSASGLEAQRLRAETITANLANAETTRTPNGGPYQKQSVVFGTNALRRGRFAMALENFSRGRPLNFSAS